MTLPGITFGAPGQRLHAPDGPDLPPGLLVTTRLTISM